MEIVNSIFIWFSKKIIFLENQYINFEYKIISYSLIIFTIAVFILLVILICYNTVKKLLRKKRNCTTCVFCLHCKEYYERTNILDKGDFDTVKENLIDEDIQLLKKGDLSFLGKEQRAKEAYIEEYNRKLKEKKEQIEKQISFININEVFKKGVVQNCLKTPTLWNEFPLKEEFGMSECPKAPEEEWLCCHKEEWGIDDEDFWPELKNHICSDYYPLSKRGRKSIKRCEQIIEKKRNPIIQTIKFVISYIVRRYKGK